MLTVHKLIPRGQGLSAVLLRRAPTVSLDWDVRQKSRFDAVDSTGRQLGVFLPRGSVARGGDVLVAEDGSLVAVQAAAQPVLVVTPCAEHGAPFDLLRAAYHLGNRHVALELRPDRLLLEPDHVLADLLRQMHLDVAEAAEPFEPEGGAYAAGGHAHSHGRGGAAAQGRDPRQGQGQSHGDGHRHDHGQSESHGHGDDHRHGHHPADGHGH